MDNPLKEIRCRINKLPDERQLEAEKYLEDCMCLFNGSGSSRLGIEKLIKLMKMFHKFGV
jgi:hypothetical protein